jgi:uncharacterized membrane protein
MKVIQSIAFYLVYTMILLFFQLVSGKMKMALTTLYGDIISEIHSGFH